MSSAEPSGQPNYQRVKLTSIFRVCELACDEDMTNFRPLELPYFRTPAMCANREFEKLASLGLKFQWPNPDHGSTRWKECISQRVTLFRHQEAICFKTGMTLLQVLTRTVYTASANAQPPDWIYTGKHIVKAIKYNHLQQTACLEEVPMKTLPWPADNTVNHNRTRLRAYLHLKQADTVFDDKSRMSSGPARSNCDFCVSLMTVSSILRPKYNFGIAMS